MSHWYTLEGVPRYTIVGANGKDRPTTLRDARKLNLVPSVTTILSVAARPGLERWKQGQLLLSALTLPKRDNETEENWLDRILEDSQEQGRQAADRGTEIHNALEAHYLNLPVPDEFAAYVDAGTRAINGHFNDWEWTPETSFAHELGFGGKVDLHTNGIVVDFKTKDFGPDDKITGFDEHCMQLAAYRVGLGMPTARCGNVFVSRSHPGLARVIEWSESELTRSFEMFKLLLDFWKLKNNYEVSK